MAPRDHAADPLLERGTPTAEPEVEGVPRGPIGNAARTLVLFGLLVVAGLCVWWFTRPDDVTERLVGREWTIVEIVGEPAAPPGGPLVTFALDHGGGLRVVDPCSAASGTWSFDPDSRTLAVDLDDDPATGCPDVASLLAGTVSVDGASLDVSGADGAIAGIAIDDHAVATADQLAGRWDGGVVVEFGRRGLLKVDGCDGSWSASGSGIVVDVVDDPAGDCRLAPIWTEDEVLLPVRIDDVLYVRRERRLSAFDREVVRLEALPDRDSPLLVDP